MSLNYVVDSLEAVDEPLRPLYEPADGKFRLKVEGVPDNAGAVTALAAERKAAREAQQQVAAWKALGKSPDEIKALIEAQTQADEDKATKAGEWDKLKAQMNAQHETALTTERGKTAAMQKALERYLITAQATTAIAAEKGVPELLLPHVERQMKVFEENGEFVARIVDAKGDPRIDAKGDPMTVAALIAEMKANDVYGRAFEASGRSGSGASPSDGRGAGKTISTTAFNALSPKERAAKMAEGYALID